jgi:hypothetical protein
MVVFALVRSNPIQQIKAALVSGESILESRERNVEPSRISKKFHGIIITLYLTMIKQAYH